MFNNGRNSTTRREALSKWQQKKGSITPGTSVPNMPLRKENSSPRKQFNQSGNRSGTSSANLKVFGARKAMQQIHNSSSTGLNGGSGAP